MSLTLDRVTRRSHDDLEPASRVEPRRPGTVRSRSIVGALCVMAAGVLLVSISYAARRHGSDAAVWVAAYWVGEVVVFAPVVVRMVRRRAPRDGETLGLVIALALSTYLVKYMYSPLAFGFPDELAHWRTTTNILGSHHLFQPNYSLPISPFYPGLENVTDALASMTGVPVFVSGLVVAGTAHLVLAGALYVLFRQVSGSARIAGLACVIYATNPHYQVFDSIFGYQTLALAFFALVLLAVARLARSQAAVRMRWWFLAVGLAAATVVTHHVTTYVLVAALLATVVVYVWRWRLHSDHEARAVGAWYYALVGAVVAMTVAWIAFVAPLTVAYLQPTFRNLVGGISSAFTAHTAAHGATPSGPFADQIANYAAALVAMIGLPVGWWRIWRTQRRNAWALAFGLGSLGYYAIALLRLTTIGGAEIAGRALTFLYVPICYVLAVVVVWGLHVTVHRIRPLVWRGLRKAGAVGVVLVLLIGGLAAGWPPYWERLPGGYVVDGFESGITPQGIAVAEWARSVLGPGNRIAADFSNYVLLGGYGNQDIVADVDDLYCSATWTPRDLAIAKQHGVRYLLVDLRMSTHEPATEGYFPDMTDTCRTPIPRDYLSKFDRLPNAARVYDSGDIIVYDLQAVDYAK